MAGGVTNWGCAHLLGTCFSLTLPSLVGSKGVQCRRKEEDEEPRPSLPQVWGLSLECPACYRQGGKGRTSTSSPTQRCCMWMGCAEDQPVCWGKSCPWCCGCSWMDLVQPLGQSCPEDVCALCMSPTSSCSCCVQVPQSPCAPCLHRGRHPACSWGSAALSQQPESRGAGTGQPGQSQAPCQSPASPACALLSMSGSPSTGLLWPYPELDVSLSETNSVSLWADPAVAGRGWEDWSRQGGKHETPPCWALTLVGLELGVVGLLLASQRERGVCPALALPAAACWHSPVPWGAALG